MSTAYSVQESNAIIASSPELCELVGSALVEVSLPAKHHDLAGQCSAYLYGSGWLWRATARMGACGGYRTDDEIVETCYRDAVAELQRMKIIPSGMAWWLLWKWIIAPYIEAMIREWLFGDSNEGAE